MINKKINNNYQTNYEYITNGNRTSLIIKSIENGNDKISYKYDKLNNITHIYSNNQLVNRYYYDEYNELIKEHNYLTNETIRYKYDNSGNILSKKVYELNTYNQLNEDKYEYNNSNWEDQLTKFNNEEITYDNIGNPLTIGDKTLTWINGRELQSYSDGVNTITYKYNKDGIRQSKTINEVETQCFTEDSDIVFEKTGNNVLYYIREVNNNLIGFKYNNDIYYYIKNAQDDIIGILDNNLQQIAAYEYDSWGKIISVKDNNNEEITDPTHIAHINPYRYRSYYFDKETGLYYLNSRYYNPIWGRFINADGGFDYTDTQGLNLYSYVGNNPINNVDSDGNLKIPKWLKKTVAVVAIVAVTVVIVAAVISSAPVAATATKIATVTTGVAVAADGASKAGEAITGTNVIRDKIMKGNDKAYGAFETTLAVASAGIIAIDQAYSIPQKAPITNKDIGRTGVPFSNTTMNKGYYNQTRFFDYKGNASLDIDFTNHPNALSYHSNPHFHIWDSGIRNIKPMNIR